MKNYIKTGGNDEKSESTLEAQSLFRQRKKEITILKKQVRTLEKQLEGDK